MSSTQASSKNLMNGMTRFLSRRDKRPSRHEHGKNRKSQVEPPTGVYEIFTTENSKKGDKEDEKKIKAIGQKLIGLGIGGLKDPQIEYALRTTYSNGDSDKALELLMLFEDSVEGIVNPYDNETLLLGAQNREMVTCYLDALLFAMFARLDSFEGMLYNNFEDEPRRRLATLLRLWINLLRGGKLITTDITRHIQEALASCGWADAKKLCQQDTSEAFTFITGKLELPLLTLKMDIYHTGKEDAQDDHKFVNERLLEVALPDMPDDSENSVTLEGCLEAYFNNKIEVKRHLQRRNTLQTPKPGEPSDFEKDRAVHVETVELGSSMDSPLVATPTSTTSPAFPKRPVNGRRRADSIFSERVVEIGESSDKKDSTEKKDYEKPPLSPLQTRRARSASIRKEVMMPAWQFFSLIPWYTENAPKSDAQVAAHFSAKRPILGICLKRYTMLPNGTPKRLNTYVDIPLEIALPHFVSDDRMDEEGPLFGNFKLSLQSVVCHRGVSVDSGHYISLVRGEAGRASQQPSSDSSPPAYKPVKWLLFDDLATPRVTEVDIVDALKRESPYLLFFRVEPIDEDLARGNPPTYDEASVGGLTADPSVEDFSTVTSRSQSVVAPVDDAVTTTATNPLPIISTTSPTSPGANIPSETPLHSLTSVRTDPTPAPAPRPASFDLPRLTAAHQSPSRHSLSSNRNSAVFSDTSTTGPSSPADDARLAFLSPSRRNSKAEKPKTKTRPDSAGAESRLAATVGLLTGRKSRDRLSGGENVTVVEVTDSTSDVVEVKQSGLGRAKSKREKRKEKRSRSEGAFTGDLEKGKDKVKGRGERPERECAVM